MRVRTIVFIGLAVLLAAPARAQAPERGAGQGRARQAARENLVTLRLLRMTEALDLSEDQTAKIFPLISRKEKDKLKIQQGMSADLKALREAILAPAPKEADLLARVAAVLEARRKVRAIDDEIDAALENLLSPVQKAKFVLFQVDFFRGLGDTLDQIRQRRGMLPPPDKK